MRRGLSSSRVLGASYPAIKGDVLARARRIVASRAIRDDSNVFLKLLLCLVHVHMVSSDFDLDIIIQWIWASLVIVVKVDWADR